MRTRPNPVYLSSHTKPRRLELKNPVALQGPLIGILTVRRPGSTSFRGNHENFRDICAMGRRLGLTVAVFTPEGLRGRDRLEGFLDAPASKGRRSWKKAILPLPAVVYNRIPDRIAEQLGAVKRVKKRLEELQIPLFNHSFFDKYQLSEWLQGSADTASFLPQTEQVVERAQIERWIQRYPLLYVKPIDGKAGDGILQVREDGKSWRVVFQKNGERTRMRCPKLSDAVQVVWQRVKGRAYLLQEGVELAALEGRPFDLRMLVQKNREGRWKVTGVGARVADADGITTHVPNGGEIARAHTTLRHAFGEGRGDEIYKAARVAALLFAETIENSARQQGRLIGELSLDVGVDVKGELWFFEANAKPMKFDEPRIRAKSLMRLLQYCTYLSQGAGKNPLTS